MEVVLSQFTKSLTKSGLMTSEQVEAFIESPARKEAQDGKTLAQELVRHKKLTKFQAQAIYQGKTKGLTLGDYVVLDRIGQGGMGQVFKAKHKVMDRVVALKTLPAAATNSELAVQRFHREVQVAARLVHPTSSRPTMPVSPMVCTIW
jgi:serine/threonine protein kinase